MVQRANFSPRASVLRLPHAPKDKPIELAPSNRNGDVDRATDRPNARATIPDDPAWWRTLPTDWSQSSESPQQSSTNQVARASPCGKPRRRKSRAATYFGDCGSRCISFRASCRGVLTNFRFMIPYPTRRTLSSSRNPIQSQLAPSGTSLNKFRPGHSWHTLDGHFSNAVPRFSRPK